MSETALIEETRQKIAEFGGMMFDRFLTDTAGGNISARVGNLICITSAGCGSKHRWHITPEQVLVTDLEGNLVKGEGKISREAKAHYALLNEFSEGTAVVHCHARNVLVFAAAGLPLDPVIEATLKFGRTPIVDYAPAHSNELAEWVMASMRGREAIITKQAALTIVPWHGLFSFGKTLDAAFDAAERMEVNAFVTLQSKLLNVDLDAQREKLVRARERFIT
ncbi:MAG: class II aldolase/adducin family protein [Chloroflexota bacterium]|nr:class II aldolase/adducin family protein [Chloroflexota bacterium]